MHRRKVVGPDADMIDVVQGVESEVGKEALKAEEAGKGAAQRTGCVQPRLDTDVIITTLGEQANYEMANKDNEDKDLKEAPVAKYTPQMICKPEPEPEQQLVLAGQQQPQIVMTPNGPMMIMPGQPPMMMPPQCPAPAQAQPMMQMQQPMMREGLYRM